MTRIGFAYNLKPDSSAEFEGRTSVPDSRVSTSNSLTSSGGSLAVEAAIAAQADDAFAEWDAPDTIDAVERALSGVGEVIRLEATEEFPERLREERPDIVFNMAEGLTGQNREAHVPAICEFLGVPYSGSDPFTLSLCLHKARTKQMLQFYGIPTANFALVETLAETKAV